MPEVIKIDRPFEDTVSTIKLNRTFEEIEKPKIPISSLVREAEPIVKLALSPLPQQMEAIQKIENIQEKLYRPIGKVISKGLETSIGRRISSEISKEVFPLSGLAPEKIQEKAGKFLLEQTAEQLPYIAISSLAPKISTIFAREIQKIPLVQRRILSKLSIKDKLRWLSERNLLGKYTREFPELKEFAIKQRIIPETQIITPKPISPTQQLAPLELVKPSPLEKIKTIPIITPEVKPTSPVIKIDKTFGEIEPPKLTISPELQPLAEEAKKLSLSQFLNKIRQDLDLYANFEKITGLTIKDFWQQAQTEKIIPTITKPEIPAPEFPHHISYLDTLSQTKLGKSFKELKDTEARKIFLSNDIKTSEIPEDKILKISTKYEPDNEWVDMSRESLITDKSGEFISDGRYLIIDKNIAEAVRNEFWEKQLKSEIKAIQRYNPDKPYKEIEEEMRKSIKENRERIKNEAEPPDYKSVIPKEKGNEASYKGIATNSLDKTINMIYSDGKIDVYLDAGYVKMLKKYFPDAKMTITAPDKAVQFWVKNELKAILLPRRPPEIEIPKEPDVEEINQKLDVETDRIEEKYADIVKDGELPEPVEDIDVGKEMPKLEERERYIQIILAEKITPAFARDMIVDLAREMGLELRDIIIGERAVGREAFGYYNADTKKVGINVMDNIRTLIHEIIGHMIDDAMGNLHYPDKFTPTGKKVRKKLIDKVYDTAGWTKKKINEIEKVFRRELLDVLKYVRPDYKTQIDAELFANYKVLLILDYGKAKQVAPTFTDAYITKLKQFPQIFNILKKFFIDDIRQNPLYTVTLPSNLAGKIGENFAKVWKNMLADLGRLPKEELKDIWIDIETTPEIIAKGFTAKVQYLFQVPLSKAMWNKKFANIYRAFQDIGYYDYNRINSEIKKVLDEKFLLTLPEKSKKLVTELIYQGNFLKTYHNINVDIDAADLKNGETFRNLKEIGEPIYVITDVLPNGSFKAIKKELLDTYGPIVASQSEEIFTIDNGELTTRYFATPEEIRAYKKIIRAINHARNYLIEFFKEKRGYYTVLDAALKKQLEVEIVDFIDKFAGYFPIDRYGDKVLFGLAPDGETMWYEMDYDITKLEEHAKFLQKIGYKDIHITDVKEPSPEIWNYRTKLSWWQLDNLVEAAGLDSSNETVQKLKKFLAQGTTLKNLLKRRFEPGYARTFDNILKSVETFGNNIARKYTKNKSARIAEGFLKNINPYKEKILYTYASKYIKNYLTTTPTEWRNLNFFIYSYYLAGKPQFPILNSLQFWMTTYANVANYVKGFKTEKIAGETHRLVFEYLKKRLNMPHNFPEEFSKLVNRLMDEGVINPQLTEEILSLKTPTTTKFKKIVGFYGSASEKFNRMRSAIAGYLTGKELKLYGEALYRFAREMVEKSDFPFNKGALPLVITDAGGLRPLLKSMYIFQGYQYHYLNMLLYNTFKGKAGSKARMWAVLLAVAGINGIIGFSLYDWIMKKFGIDTNLEIRKMTKNPVIANLVLKGLPTLIGIDLSRSAGFGELINPVENFAEQVFGAPYSTLKRIAKGFLMITKEKEPMRGLAVMMPSAIGYGISALTGMREGLRTSRLTPLVQLTGYEAFLRGMGFMPTGLSEAYERRGAEKFIIQRPKEIKSSYLKQLAMAKIRKDDEAYNRVLNEVKKYNQTARPDQKISITYKEITDKIKELSFDTYEFMRIKRVPKKARQEIRRIRELYTK
ncbi:MAG: PLxRFG domain-containing protein [Euryarchaeota archaeon]|nr:PLxRFG domain-containing protein [Euryarchaeota archaeon]